MAITMKRAITILLTVALATAAAAQQDAVRERGFRPEQAYQFNSFDSVNLFNGNLNLAVPLGEPYPVAAGLSYSFVLRYSGNIWKTVEHCVQSQHGTKDCTMHYLRHGSDNASPGWRVSFGELRAPSPTAPARSAGSMWEYKTADAGEHLFYDRLHECGTSGPCEEPAADNVYYTRDGTYLRLKTAPDGAKVVEFGDGQRQRFKATGSKWDLEYIYSTASTLNSSGVPTTNFVRFQYVANAQDLLSTDWLITDSHGRSHRVYFRGSRIDKVEVAAFKLDSDTGAVSATYNLAYGAYTTSANGDVVDGPGTKIRMPCDSWLPTMDVNFLRALLLPSGEEYLFSYNEQTTAFCDDQTATLTQVTLPTGGRIGWKYQRYAASASPSPEATYESGVKERTVRDTAGALLQKTIYSVGDGVEAGQDVTVQTCGGILSDTACSPVTKSVHHFITAVGPSFGLPFSPSLGEDSLAQSTQIFACSSGSCSSTPKRTTFVRFEMDFVPSSTCSQAMFPCSRDRNRRVVSERTRYDDDDERLIGNELETVYADTNHSDFDGLGHYRTTNTGGNFASGNASGAHVNYNSHSRGGGSVGTYSATATGPAAGYTMLLASDPWILGTWGSTYKIENGQRTDALACFDAATGFLKARRKLASQDETVSAHDLLEVFTRDTVTGFVKREEYFGGDKQNVGSTALCSLTPPPHDQYSYRIDHTYDYGVRKTSRYMPNGVAMPFFSLQNTIDLNTGFVSASADAAGVTTKYNYDRAGRLANVTPPIASGLSATTYNYVKAAGGLPATVTVTTGTGTVRVSKKYEFDALGRIWREHELMPDDTWSVVQTAYDALGRRLYVSEKETYTNAQFTPANKTDFSNYDVFGRVGNIKTPDGKETTITHTGERLTTKTVPVVTNFSGGTTNANTVEERDRAGRLWKVTENAGDSTTYGYHVTGNLASVTMGDQSRTFSYDGRGILTSEQHSESGITSYEYDARGHVVKRDDANASGVVTTEYDGAERVLKVFSDGVLLKEFIYDRANFEATTTDYSLGKLAEAIRHNRSGALGDVIVREKFIYGTKHGLLSKKETSITTVKNNVTTTGASLYETYSYNALGTATEVGYPKCEPACSPTAAPSRTLTTTMKHGRVTDVGPYTNSVTYHPNGMLHQVRHADADGLNGPLYEQSIANGMARPANIAVSEFCSENVLRIDTPPVSGEVSYNASANRSVVATGATQWKWFRMSGANSIELPDQTTATLTTTVTQETKFWVRVGNGSCTVDSDIVTVSVSSCAPPDAEISTSPAIVPRNGNGTASVTPTTGATYLWTIQGGGTITSSPTAASISFSVGCSGTPVTLQVKVTASCGEFIEDTHPVAIGPGATVTVTPQGSSTILQNESKQLNVVITGMTATQWTVKWSHEQTSSTTSLTSFSKTVFPLQTTDYFVTVTPAGTSCASYVSNVVKITVVPPAPTGVVATATSSTQVNVTWSFSGNVDQFDIERRGAGQSSFQPVGAVAGTALSWRDDFAVANQAYLYRVVATKAQESSSPSEADLATTAAFGSVVALDVISPQDVIQLRTAVNAIRALGGTGLFSFTDASLSGVKQKVIHVTELRTTLDQARAVLGLPAVSYTLPAPGFDQLIRAHHINDLRGGVR
jgi:YD repeat-containing protein